MVALQFCEGMRVHTAAEISQGVAEGRIEMLEGRDEAEVPVYALVAADGGASFFRHRKGGQGRSFEGRQYIHIRPAEGHEGTAPHGTGYQPLACGFGVGTYHGTGCDIQSGGKGALGGQGIAGLEQAFGHTFCKGFCYALVATAGTCLFVQAFHYIERHIAPLE